MRELNRDEGRLFEKLRKEKASIDASFGTNKEKYKKFTTLLEKLVQDLIQSVIGEPLSCTKTALPGGGEGEWDENEERLRNFDALVFGHFETADHNLGGNLLAARSDLEKDGLRATVWNLLWYYGVNLFDCVVTNIVPWAAPHDHGRRILSGIPPDVISFLNELTKAKLECLGEPEKVAGFGAHVRTFADNQGYTNVRVPWTFHFDSPHLSLFTTSAPRSLFKEHYDAFGALVSFLGGKEGAGEDLHQARVGEAEDETTREMLRARRSEAVSEASQEFWRNHKAAGTLHPAQVGVRAFWRNHQVGETLHPSQEVWRKHQAAGTLHPAQVGSRAFWRNHQVGGTLHPVQEAVQEVWRKHQAAGTLHPAQVGSRAFWRNHQVGETLHPAQEVWRKHQAAGTLHPAQVGSRAFWRNHQVGGTLHPAQEVWRKHQAAGTLHPARIAIKKKAKDRGTVQIPPGFVCDSCGHSCEREASFTIDKRRGTFRRKCSNCIKRNKKEMSASYNFTKLTSIRKFFDGGRGCCFNTSEKKKAFANTIVKKIKSEPGLSEVARNAEDAMKNYFNHRTITSFFSPAPPAPSLLPPPPPPAPISTSYPPRFTSIRIDADGNCQFRAIADQMYGNQDDHEVVRQEVISEMENNSERYIEGLYMLRVADLAEYEVETGMRSQADMDQGEMWTAYIAELRRGPLPNTSFGWGDDITLQAAANLYGVQIQVYGGSPILVQNLNGTAERTLHLFCKDSHYTSLRERTE